MSFIKIQASIWILLSLINSFQKGPKECLMVNHNNSCWLNIRKSEEKKLSKCIEHVCIKANTIPFGEHKKFKKKKTHHQLSISGHKLSLVFKCCSELLQIIRCPFYQFIHCNCLLIQNHLHLRFSQFDTEYIYGSLRE